MNLKGVIIRESPYTVKETIDRLEAIFKQRGVTIYVRINQQDEVSKAAQNLLPLEFIMFGSPRAGGPLMAENPLTALDLPLKVIAWQDEQQKVWLAYNDALYIEERYSLKHNPNSPLDLTHLIDAVFTG